MTVGAGTANESITNLTWYPFGPRAQAKFPPEISGTNSVTSTRAINLRGQITDIDIVSGSTAILDRSYTYDYTTGSPGPNDPGPNLDRVVDTLDSTESRFYFYDELDRLEKATTLTGTVLHQYAYDAVGNRTSKVGPLGTSGYSYESATNRLDAATGAEARDYAHDAYGSRIYDGTAAFTGTPSLLYDDANRLAEVRDPANSFATLATYTYDAFGRRIKKVAGTKTILFFYDSQGHLIEEIEKIAGAGNDEARSYVFLEDELVGIVDQTQEAGAATWIAPVLGIEDIEPPVVIFALAIVAGIGVTLVTRRVPAGLATTTSGAVLILLCASGVGAPRFSWVHVDPLGTPLAVTDTPATGNAVAVWRAKYEPFGKATVDEDPDGNAATFALAVRFPGQYEDGETRWHYNFYRTYDPSTGRYLEPDPIGLRGGANLYGYANQDPLNFADPSGLEAVSEMFRQNWGLPKGCDCYRIITIAQRTLGSGRWALDVPNGDFGAGQNKCNLYVCDVISEALGWCPRRWGGLGGPISAGTWGDPDAEIPGFPVVKTPQLGDVAAVPFPYSNATGHVGFVSGPRSTISAPGGPVTETGWPWDPNSNPQGTPVFRRCTCE